MVRISLRSAGPEEAVAGVLNVLRSGGIVGYPTESFYALGVMANNEAALRKLYKLKKRPAEKAMPLIVGSDHVLRTVVRAVPPYGVRLMKRFWPGALTLIFDAGPQLPELLVGQRRNIAARIPGKSFALYLAREANFPITATSANISGRAPSRTPDEIAGYFGEGVDLVVDNGMTPGGRPSTIIDVTAFPPVMVREGSIPKKSLDAYL